MVYTYGVFGYVVEATDIVQNVVLLLVKHVLWKKIYIRNNKTDIKKKKKKRKKKVNVASM
jgi:hypothetical protein